VNVELFVRVTAEGADDDRLRRRGIYRNACEVDEQPEMDEQPMAAGSILQLAPSPRNAHPPEALSGWSCSPAKRALDFVSVILALPLFAPLLLLVGIAVRLTSAGPILFRQQRVGRGGRLFTILKFRTMIHNPDAAYNAITTDGNQPFTCIGPLLRRWKLDELPQILNVLRGDMSLVGQRPKMPEHVINDLC
jgi:lipopolysaccharide/colanic/teichoic acid biosynthesis glycosyltransferase